MQNQDWRDAAMDLVLTEHRRVETIYFLMNEDNLALQLKQPWIKIGTDSVGVNPENARDLAHPRSYGTFPRILGEFVREKKVIPLEEAIRKMTSATARRLSIADRGMLDRACSQISWHSTPLPSQTAPPTSTRTSCRPASAG